MHRVVDIAPETIRRGASNTFMTRCVPYRTSYWLLIMCMFQNGFLFFLRCSLLSSSVFRCCGIPLTCALPIEPLLILSYFSASSRKTESPTRTSNDSVVWLNEENGIFLCYVAYSETQFGIFSCVVLETLIARTATNWTKHDFENLPIIWLRAWQWLLAVLNKVVQCDYFWTDVVITAKQ